MSFPRKSGEDEVAHILRVLGCEPKLVPRSNEKTPDIIAHAGSSTAIIEVKDKFDRAEIAEVRKRDLDQTGRHERGFAIRPSNRLSGIAKSGVKQIRAQASEETHFRILWFNLRTSAADAERLLLRNTIYGISEIMGRDDPYVRPCYFFHDSVFYSLRNDLDGVVSAVFDGSSASIKFHLNPLSPRLDTLLSSDFLTCFQGATENPIEEEVLGSYILPSDVDRHSPSSEAAFAREKILHGPPANI
ncbi:MAG: hypothetical protein R3D63_01450 [Paracoccaceae bacterium]